MSKRIHVQGNLLRSNFRWTLQEISIFEIKISHVVQNSSPELRPKVLERRTKTKGPQFVRKIIAICLKKFFEKEQFAQGHVRFLILGIQNINKNFEERHQIDWHKWNQGAEYINT